MKQGYNGTKGIQGETKKFFILIYRWRLQGNIVFRFFSFLYTRFSFTLAFLYFSNRTLFFLFCSLGGFLFLVLFSLQHKKSQWGVSFLPLKVGGGGGGGGGGE